MRRPAAPSRDVLRGVFAVLGWGVLLAILSYRTRNLVPVPGLDPSWQAGLHLSARQELDWGSDLGFTYGPLGYLSIAQLFYDAQGVAALAWSEGVRALALGLLFVRARRTLGGVAAFVAVALIGVPLQTPEVVVGATVAFVVAVRDTRHPQVRTLLAAMAVLAGLAVMVKISEGVAIGALAALAALVGPGTRRERVRDLGLLAGVFGLAFLLLWILTGQALGDLPVYVSTTGDVVSGYAEAMQLELPDGVADYSLALLLTAAGVAVAWRLDGVVGRRARAAAVALWLGVAWLQFKSGFVRHDPGHAFIFFTTLAGLGLAVAADRRLRADTIALAVGGLAIVIAVGNQRLDQLWSPIDGVRATWEQTLDVADGAERERVRAAGVSNIRAALAIPPEVLADAAPHPVHVFPSETSAVWAYNLKWAPLPIFQSYVAYTESLAEKNADRLADPREGPARVLVHAGSERVDGRLVAYDEPAVALALLCGFRVSVASERWLSLARGPQRCAAPRRLGRMRARWGEQVAVPTPSPSSIVVASVEGVAVSGLERLRTLAYKAHERFVLLGGQRQRLVPDAATGPLMVRSDGVDLPGAFAMVPQAATIGFDKGGGKDDGDELEVTFSEIAVRSG